MFRNTFQGDFTIHNNAKGCELIFVFKHDLHSFSSVNFCTHAEMKLWRGSTWGATWLIVCSDHNCMKKNIRLFPFPFAMETAKADNLRSPDGPDRWGPCRVCEGTWWPRLRRKWRRRRGRSRPTPARLCLGRPTAGRTAGPGRARRWDAWPSWPAPWTGGPVTGLQREQNLGCKWLICKLTDN